MIYLVKSSQTEGMGEIRLLPDLHVGPEFLDG